MARKAFVVEQILQLVGGLQSHVSQVEIHYAGTTAVGRARIVKGGR